MRLASLLALSLCLPLSLPAQAPAAAGPDPLTTLDFLVGTWSAKTANGGYAGMAAAGNYSFHRDLKGHVLQRTGTTDTCKGPATADCQHNDQLTVFPDADGLHALYLDSEGHVIHYIVTTPDPHTVIFLSDSPAGAPHFRLTYHLEGATMNGRFEFAAPGTDTFNPYLVWSGTRQ